MNNIKESEFRDAKEAYDYAYINNCRLNLENKRLLSISQQYSYLYARGILKERFKLGEKVIATDISYSYCYVKNILKNNLPLDFLELCIVEVLEHLLHSEIFLV